MIDARARFATFVALLMLAAGLAGCLAQESQGEPTISRVHTFTLSPDTTKRAEAHGDDPQAALREFLKTDIVVRVKDEGDYALEYTDARGAAQVRQLPGLRPGTPTAISGVDPLAPAVLKRGEEVVTLRAGLNTRWWHAGDMPLGVTMLPGAKATYALDTRAEYAARLADLDLKDQNVTGGSVSFSLKLPLAGRASWVLGPDAGEGNPLDLAGELSIPATAGDLVTLELAATYDGKPGTAGVIGGVSEARVGGEARMWIKDGAPAASQFMGGHARITPKALAWSDGFFAEQADGFSCAGRSRADACSPSEAESIDEREPAGEKEVIDPKDFPVAQTDDERAAFTLIERIFAQDLLPGDRLVFIAEADSSSLGADADVFKGKVFSQFSIEAVGEEDVKVPAGTFRALKVLEETRTRADVSSVADDAGAPVMKAFAFDETVARTTFWLDTKSYQPIKMVAETPLDLDALLKRLYNAVDPNVWDKMGGRPVEPSQWSVKVTATSSYEATELTPGAQFSPVVGLGLAHGLAGVFVGAPGAFLGAAPLRSSHGTEYAVPVVPEQPPWPAPPQPGEPARMASFEMQLKTNAPPEAGVGTFTVASVSPGIPWDRVSISIDGTPTFIASQRECAAPQEYEYSACRSARALTAFEDVMGGDTIKVRASSGQMLAVVDSYSQMKVFVMIVP